MKELKIQILDYRKIEEKLKNLGGELYETKKIVDTYFKTKDANSVLKIAEYDSETFFLEELEKNQSGGFEIINEKKIEGLDKANEIKAELKIKFGVKCILKAERHYFRFSQFRVIINLIDNVGEFLILTGENISEEMITKTLKIENPKFIRVPFSDLRTNNLKNNVNIP